jgi:hypothetical protein
MDVRRADVAFRRVVFAVLGASACAAALLIRGLEQYQEPLSAWVRADAGRSTQRIELVVAVFAILLVAPLVAVATYLSSLGRRAVRSGEFPPPGTRVIRDTPIARGAEALSRGRVLQGVAVFLWAAAVVTGMLLWRLAGFFAVRMG